MTVNDSQPASSNPDSRERGSHVCDMCGKQIPPPGEGESATCDDCIEIWFDEFVIELLPAIRQMRGTQP